MAGGWKATSGPRGTRLLAQAARLQVGTAQRHGKYGKSRADTRDDDDKFDGHWRLPGSCPRVQEPGAEALIQINAPPQAFAVAGASSVARRPGRHRPAIAAISDSTA